MKIVVWNILHGGGHKRMASIAVELIERSPDIVVLNEFRATMGGQLQGILTDHGLTHHTLGADPRHQNVVLVASKFASETLPVPAEIAPRVIESRIPDLNCTLLAVHIPDESSPTRRRLAWQYVASRAKALRGENCLICGDFNTGRHRVDESGSTFSCTEYLGALATAGYADAFRSLHGMVAAPTWVAANARKSLGKSELQGFRIDGAFLSQPLREGLKTAEYSHDVRLNKVSDHSIFTLEIEIPRESVEKKSEKTRENVTTGVACDLIAPLFMV